LEYADLLATHERRACIGTMVLAQPYDSAIPPNVCVEPDGRVTCYAKGEQVCGLNATDAGVVVFNKSVLELIRPGKPRGLEHDVFARLSAMDELSGYTAATMFYDMGSPTGTADTAAHLRRRAFSC